MANDKFYTVPKTIGGKDYLAQYNGNSQYYEFQDKCKKNIGGVAEVNMVEAAKFIFENVIVKPNKLTLDDFDNADDTNDVINFGIEVMQGNFRDKKNKAGATGTSKE